MGSSAGRLRLPLVSLVGIWRVPARGERKKRLGTSASKSPSSYNTLQRPSASGSEPMRPRNHMASACPFVCAMYLASTGWSIDQRRGAPREAGRVLAIGLAIGSAVSAAVAALPCISLVLTISASAVPRAVPRAVSRAVPRAVGASAAALPCISLLLTISARVIMYPSRSVTRRRSRRDAM